VKVLRYPDHIKIFHRRKLLIEYPLPPVQVKNQKFYPPDRPKPRHEPRDRKNRTGEEEKILRSMSETIDAQTFPGKFQTLLSGPLSGPRFEVILIFNLYLDTPILPP
jgi:hypothetical protein